MYIFRDIHVKVPRLNLVQKKAPLEKMFANIGSASINIKLY